jgi:sugar O-acyltransferase (sialic acid O-acetyltransferase NeuD family)|tara:strand:+ start:583 stop:1218 length:636 start_codon:yes stop_codon:yes gene_type:complete
MIKKNFCLVGVDNDFEDFVLDNKKFYLGLFTNFKNKKFSINKKLGKENLSDWLKIKKKFNPDLFILIDDGKQRENLRKKIYQSNNKNLLLDEKLISKSSLKYLSKKSGVIIQKSVLISSHVKINEGVKIHIGSQIHHGVSIDKYSTISPASIILGNVKIGKYSFIGANSTIRQKIKIGNHCVIGAGAVVVRDVKDGETVVGNPATKINYKK